jgi:cytoskeletal protein CcmA (bactofilin family)
MFGRKRQDGEDGKPEAERGPEDLIAPLAKPPSRPAMPPPINRPPVLPPRLGAGEPLASPATTPPATPAPPLPVTPPAQAIATPKPPAEPFRRVSETPIVAPEKPMRQLIVGRDISLNGEINSCDRLLVEGNVEANLTNCTQVEISEHGLFRGTATVDEVEIHGRFEGSLTVKKRLFIRASGRVSGTIRYGEIEIERGGQISGDVQAQAADALPASNSSTIDQQLVQPNFVQTPLSYN